MGRIVMKFGGTSLAKMADVRHAAGHIVREVEAGEKVAVVVSAMGGSTDSLVALAEEAAVRGGSGGVGGDGAGRGVWKGAAEQVAAEWDGVVATGEQVSAGVLALVLQSMGVRARSWQGWQAGVATDGRHGSARIQKMQVEALARAIDEGEVAVVAGFQGVTVEGRIATLGRGGSDTSAVALAAALEAVRCDMYTDVDGVYTADPRVVVGARKLERIAFEEMLEVASLGARVIQTRAAALAMREGVRVRVRCAFEAYDAPQGAKRSDERPGTLLCAEEEIVEKKVVSGITYTRGEAKITVVGVEDRPGVAMALFSPLAEAEVSVDMIVQNVGVSGRTDLTFTVAEESLSQAVDILEKAKGEVAYESLKAAADVAKVSVVGVGMREHPGVARTMFETLGREGINIGAIATSEIRISVLLEARYVELAVRALHAAYGLDEERG